MDGRCLNPKLLRALSPVYFVCIIARPESDPSEDDPQDAQKAILRVTDIAQCATSYHVGGSERFSELVASLRRLSIGLILCCSAVEQDDLFELARAGIAVVGNFCRG